MKKSVATGITGTEQQLASHPDTSEETSEIFFFFFPEILKLFFLSTQTRGRRRLSESDRRSELGVYAEWDQQAKAARKGHGHRVFFFLTFNTARVQNSEPRLLRPTTPRSNT